MNSLSQSLLIHALLALVLMTLFFLNNNQPSFSTPIEFELIDKIITDQPREVEIQVTKPLPQIENDNKITKAIFGVAKKAHLADEGGSGVEIKTGNTLAKTVDTTTLNPNDAESIPIPTEEYLITKMPRLIKDVKVPYSDEARKKGITGQVMMDILIDKNGSVRSAILLKSLEPSLDQAALNSIKFFQFDPAKMGTDSVAVKIRYAITFVLEN